jgi:hypothetical protein
MEQNQMSKFCINLESMMLPDAIAAVVEAWYDAQNAGNMAKQNHGPYRPGEPIENPTTHPHSVQHRRYQALPQ